MNTPRRADSRSFVTVVRVLLGVLASALALTLGALAAVVLLTARRVITPSGRVADVEITGLDARAQTITLKRNADTQLPGRYGLFTQGSRPYLKLGSVVAQDDATVTRKLLTEVDPQARLDSEAQFSGWYYDTPDQLHLPYQAELIGASIGPCPAWFFPGTSDTWVIQVHGRGTTRAECLRAVPVLHDAGMPVLIVSYRNDGEAPHSRDGKYGLGATEWRDVDAAVSHARRHGARRIILMGWSMGGAIVLQLKLHSANRDMIAGVILDSPVVDWRGVLDFQAELIGLPRPVANLAMGTLGAGWGARVSGADAPISFDGLDVVAQAGDLDRPLLILHSDDDGFVPSTGSHRLAEARPDLVRLEVFSVARHTKLWNYDQTRWDDAIASWLADNGFSEPQA